MSSTGITMGLKKHYLEYEAKADQMKAAEELVMKFCASNSVKVYDVDIACIYFVQRVQSIKGKKWVAQTAHLKHQDSPIEIEFITVGWDA